MDRRVTATDVPNTHAAAPFPQRRDRRPTFAVGGRRCRAGRLERARADAGPRMAHEEAWRIVQAMDIIEAARGAASSDLDRVRTALDDHADAITALNSLDPAKAEETPQGAAAHHGCREILQLMVSRGVRPDIFTMAALGLADDLRWLLRRSPHLANARGAHGIHALNHASDRVTTDLLLHLGADPNCLVYELWDWTPVHEAAAADRVDTLAALADYGGRVDGALHSTTALHAAAQNGSIRAARWLLDNGAAADPIGRGGPYEGRTAREIATERGHGGVLATLEAAAAPVSLVAVPLPVARATSGSEARQ